MGLEIMWQYEGAVSRKDAIGIVSALREKALRTYLDEVGDVNHRLLIPAQRRSELWPPGTTFVDNPDDPDYRAAIPVPPLETVHFSTYHEGSETALFGLARHPSVVRHGRLRLPTNTHGRWSWGGGCKTQFAGGIEYGGFPNFLKAHVSLVEILDGARDLGLAVRVHDDGDYWDTRDERVLRSRLQEWNGTLASLAGLLEDVVGEAPVVGGTIDLQTGEFQAPRSSRRRGRPR